MDVSKFKNGRAKLINLGLKDKLEIWEKVFKFSRPPENRESFKLCWFCFCFFLLFFLYQRDNRVIRSYSNINDWDQSLQFVKGLPCSRFSGGCGFVPRLAGNILSWRFDHEIFSVVILSLLLIQEGQFSISGERIWTILLNRLED